MILFRKVSILGAGLLGASLGRALKKFGVSSDICVWSRSQSTREKCLSEDWCDSVCHTPEECVKDADLTMLCATIDAIEEHMKLIAPVVKQGAIVSDVGSTKAFLCTSAKKIFKDSKGVFVGSHPMAGSEKSGLEYASADLFKDRPCFVTIDPKASQAEKSAAEKLAQMWRRIGAAVETISSQEHDRIVARISHLPHILAANLSALTASMPDSKNLAFAASSGFKDTTRVAGGNPDIWRSIFSTNRIEIVSSLNDYIKQLSEFKDALNEQKSKKTQSILKRGQSFRNSL